jgi:hypothetical protein
MNDWLREFGSAYWVPFSVLKVGSAKFFYFCGS